MALNDPTSAMQMSTSLASQAERACVVELAALSSPTHANPLVSAGIQLRVFYGGKVALIQHGKILPASNSVILDIVSLW